MHTYIQGVITTPYHTYLPDIIPITALPNVQKRRYILQPQQALFCCCALDGAERTTRERHALGRGVAQRREKSDH
eukprot:2392279-Pleurochrysis_carterae.AAC.1